INYVTANFFRNRDNLSAGNANYSMNTSLNWRNSVGSVCWRGVRSTQVTAYVSEFESNLTVALPQNDVLGRSSIVAYGLTGQTELVRLKKCVLTGGLDAGGFRITPLWAYMEGVGSSVSAPERIQNSWELRAFADARFRLSQNLTVRAGLSASTFGGRYFAIDPRANADWQYGDNVWTFGAGVFSQYLHQVGFSDIGLASNFWYGSNGRVKPQRSLDLTAGWQRKFLNDELTVSATAYFKRVVAQSEYQGQVLDIITSDYDAQRSILISNGYNAGVILEVQKSFGALTGQLSYSYGYAMRRHGGEWFRSITDAGHQFKADIDYEFNSHWSAGAGFIFASGRVYTPTRYLYVIANRIMSEYGKRNSSRFPPYQHLDLWATYRAGRHSVNLSIINVYGYRNVEIQYFGLNSHSGHYELYRQYSLYRFLPSISYSLDF
ncbi:MAG: TonB-dependent receptor, partial [Muribaculaceae bacterium]|nr:TonB-dependent receptor [Muribaculaceae bacterium]